LAVWSFLLRANVAHVGLHDQGAHLERSARPLRRQRDACRAIDAGSRRLPNECSLYEHFTANSGRLTVQGHELTYEAYVGKDPKYMASFEDNGATATWEANGSTLTLVFTSGFLDGGTATFRRPTNGE